MVKIILGIIAGFIAWSIIWVGSDQVLMMASPDWYGAHQLGFERAMTNKDAFVPDSTILVMHIVRSIITSLMAGFLAVVISGEHLKTTWGLGILLLLAGIAVEALAWNYLPIWYHLIFLVLLIPMTIVGGKLKSQN
jgi:hypothetical protein